MALSPDSTLAEVIDTITKRGATTYLGLLVADIGNTDTMATMQEYVGAGYARVAVTWTVPTAPNVGDPIVSSNVNSATFTFTADATQTVLHVVLVTVLAGTTGTIRRVWPVATPFTPKAGDTFTINIGDLVQGAA
ncbi:hypothetical protein [Terracoccus sp. 273MFTsu3.1]|uniref:phage tail fiber protein n=1 Tax=Terracoccus sp. 273MFTsu3.1 TaxID=1172188 RepID=UPI000372F76A|nr:hypothetical protein [Terracoccus sp. 273MFTsu3.1]